MIPKKFALENLIGPNDFIMKGCLSISAMHSVLELGASTWVVPEFTNDVAPDLEHHCLIGTRVDDADIGGVMADLVALISKMVGQRLHPVCRGQTRCVSDVDLRPCTNCVPLNRPWIGGVGM